jgi:hypothetical protein
LTLLRAAALVCVLNWPWRLNASKTSPTEIASFWPPGQRHFHG